MAIAWGERKKVISARAAVGSLALATTPAADTVVARKLPGIGLQVRLRSRRAVLAFDLFGNTKLSEPGRSVALLAQSNFVFARPLPPEYHKLEM